MTNQTEQKTQWHHIFAALLDELLSPVGIKVKSDVPISLNPPEIDIILMQQVGSGNWTDEQRAYLPDGIRDSLADQASLELKITETVDKKAIEQVLMYDIGYRRSTAKQKEQVTVQSFLVSAKTPDPSNGVLEQYGYQATEQAGIYRSDNIFIKELPLILLNELSDEAHNVFFKLFASRMTVKRSAVRSLRRWWLAQLSAVYSRIITKLVTRRDHRGDINRRAVKRTGQVD